MSEVTRIISQIQQGHPSAAAELLPLVYQELRQLATAKLASEQPGQTLQATALVHEAYLRLVDVDKPQSWDSRGHFFGAAAEAMRRILIEHARRKKSDKGGGGRQRVSLEESKIGLDCPADDLLALDEALEKLAAENETAGQIAKLRLFGGLTVDEAAANMNLSRRTGFRHWTYARAFLQAELITNEL